MRDLRFLELIHSIEVRLSSTLADGEYFKLVASIEASRTLSSVSHQNFPLHMRPYSVYSTNIRLVDSCDLS